jgi:hypothetical protein
MYEYNTMANHRITMCLGWKGQAQRHLGNIYTTKQSRWPTNEMFSCTRSLTYSLVTTAIYSVLVALKVWQISPGTMCCSWATRGTLGFLLLWAGQSLQEHCMKNQTINLRRKQCNMFVFINYQFILKKHNGLEKLTHIHDWLSHVQSRHLEEIPLSLW